MDKLSAFSRFMKPARGVICDFDGLLADSERYHFLSYREVFSRYGHTVKEKEYYKFWTSLGLGAKGEIERYGLKLDPTKIVEEKKPIFSRYCKNGSVRLFKEAKEIVPLLAAAGKRLAIASGSSKHDIFAVLENEDMEEYFPVILGKESVEKVKPAPDIFLKAAEIIGLAKEKCVVLEDAEKGMFAAKAASIPVIIVKSSETRPFDFAAADLTLDSTAELLQLLKKVFP